MKDEIKEFDAIKNVHQALKDLDEHARNRVIRYVVDLFGIAQVAAPHPNFTPPPGSPTDPSKAKFDSFAELYDAAGPKTAAESALVAGYWLQVCEGNENFSGAEANKNLKLLGHGLTHTSQVIDSLRNQKPALVLQLKKGGTTKQARKTYKISHAGEKRVQEMINGQA